MCVCVYSSSNPSRPYFLRHSDPLNRDGPSHYLLSWEGHSLSPWAETPLPLPRTLLC